MRDIAVTLAVFGTLPFILRRPWLGIIVWTWLGFMNPHRLAWGFATTMPFAQMVAIATIVGMLMSRESMRLPWTRENILLLLFVLWMVVTTMFALVPPLAWEQLEKVLKIQAMIFVAMMLINTRERLHLLVATIAASLAFYGVKGGIFTIMTGGVHRVQGPPNTFIGGNNEIGLALAMTVPLLYYLYRTTTRRLVRIGIMASIVLTSLAAIGTQSRGALLGMGAMGVMLWLRGKQKLMILILAGLSAYAITHIMPEKWYERMQTITNYEGDKSVEGRFIAWKEAYQMATERFLGGGFETLAGGTDAHSIYFEVLGEHGFVGLGLFLMLGLTTWFAAWRIRRQAHRHKETMWLAELSRMVQVSIAAYATAGAFLGMAYFDYFYNLVLIVVMSRVVLKKELAAMASPSAQKTGPPAEAAHPGGMALPGQGHPTR
jgi:probable O-glycosylation ligase (exosortase A-associated)